MNKKECAYWAGVFDADGSITLSLSLSRTKNPSILITPHMRIGWKEIYHETLEQIQQESGLGKIYYSNKGKPHGMVFWQTTNLADAIALAENVVPYMVIKKERTQNFIEICKYWKKTDIRKNRRIGERTRNKEDITRIVKIAITMNEGRQTERWRGWRGWDYWKKIIDRLY